MRIKLLIALIFFLIVSAAAYTGLWFFWAQQITSQITAFKADMAEQGTVIDGAFSAVSGFPAPPTISFTGRIAGGAQAFNIPLLTAHSFFLPGMPVTLDLPQGLSVQSPDLDAFSSTLDQLRLTARIPTPLPAGLTARDLYRWQETGARLDIQDLYIKKGDLIVKGEGHVTLDDRLQPAAALPVQIYGHVAFLSELQQRKLIETRAAIVTGVALGSLMKNDDKGTAFVPVTLTIQKSTLYAGPLRVFDIPPLFWPE